MKVREFDRYLDQHDDDGTCDACLATGFPTFVFDPRGARFCRQCANEALMRAHDVDLEPFDKGPDYLTKEDIR